MLDIQNYIGSPKIVVEEKGNGLTQFVVQYLPRGFGHTLGNGMRRIILGYNLGGSVTAVKIKGYTHEYQVISGVKESILDINLYIKKLRFRVDESVDSLQWVTQTFSGVGVYTAKDLKIPSGVEVVSKDEYLCEITDPNVKLVIDLRIEKGYGYYSMDFLKDREQQQEFQDADIMLIDNDFRVVDYVTYDVEEVIDDFKGGLKDKLILEVKSKYDIVDPKEFLSFAGEVLASYAKLFIFDEAYIDRSVLMEYEEIERESKATQEESVKTMPIDALPLSERTRNALIKNEVLYVEDLEKKKKGELLLMKGVGRKAIEEINASLENIGKSLAG